MTKHFSGIMARYEVEQIFVKVVKDPSDNIIDLEKDTNGEVVFYNEEDTTNGIYSGVKVADKLGSKGDGTDILVGIDVLTFLIIKSKSQKDMKLISMIAIIAAPLV